MRHDKRAQFFLLAAVACFLLVPVAPEDYQRLAAAVGAVYVVLSIASALDYHGRHKG